MSSLTNYIKNSQNYQNSQRIYDKLDNNIPIIEGKSFFLENAHYIDTTLEKFGRYTNNQLYHADRINESTYDESFNIHESEAAKGILVYVAEDYLKALNKDLRVYEAILNDEEIVDEGFTDIINKARNFYQEKKEKVKEAWEELKIKIKEIKEFIAQIINKTIDSVKSMAATLLGLLEKFNCTVAELIGKCGLNTKKAESSWMEHAKQMASSEDFEKLIKQDVYESYANQIRSGEIILLEDEQVDDFLEEDPEIVKADDKNGSVKQADKKGIKQMLWDAFKQFAIWACVCVVIPGLVVAFFPGTFIALLVPMACKLAWNGYKIVKLWRQFKKVKSEWKTYKKFQKWITVITMTFSIIALFFNFQSLIGDSGTVLKAFVNNGCKLFQNANLGIQPDFLTRGFAAFVKMITEGKFNWDDLQETFKSITDSFAEHTSISEYGCFKTQARLGQDGENFVKQWVNGNENNESSMIAWKSWHAAEMPMDQVDKLPDDAVVDVIMDGTKGAKWFGELDDHLKGMGEKILGAEGFRNVELVQATGGRGGGGTLVKLSGKAIKALIKGGVKLSHNDFGLNSSGHMTGIAVIGALVDKVQYFQTAKEVITAASSMLMTIPSFEPTFENNGGFKVRLGQPGTNNYVYEIGKDGVKIDDVSKHADHYQEIKKRVQEDNDKYYDIMKKALEKSKGKEDIKKQVDEKIKEFDEKFNDKSEAGKCVIFYGKKIKEDDEVKENFNYHRSLKDYIIAEGIKVTIDPKIKGKDLSWEDKKKNIEILKQYFLDRAKELDNAEEVQADINAIFGKLEGRTVSSVAKDAAHKLKPAFSKFAERDNLDDEDYRTLFHNIGILSNNIARDRNEGTNRKDRPFEEVNNDAYDYIMSKLENTVEHAEETKQLKDAERKAKVEDEEKRLDQEQEEKNKDGEEVPVLMFVNGYGIDIADATKSGPREELYSLKGVMSSLEFTEIKGGTSLKNIEKMLGGFAASQLIDAYRLNANKPCKSDEKKYELYDYKDNDEARPGFANFSNKEIQDIVKKKNGEKYVGLKYGKVTAAQSKSDKEILNKYKQRNEEIISNDKNVLDRIKKINPDIVDKNGNVNKDEVNRLNDRLGEYQLSKRKEKSEKGFFGRMWAAIKSFFGFKDDDNDDESSTTEKKKPYKYTDTDIKDINNAIKDSHNKNKENSETKDAKESFDYISLKDYIIINS